MSDITVTSGDAYVLDGTDDRRFIITVTKAGVTVDLTGITATLMVKRHPADAAAAALITKTIGSGLTLASPQSGATKGVCYLSLDEADTADLAYRNGGYPWELEAVDAVGTITLASGRFRVIADLITGA